MTTFAMNAQNASPGPRGTGNASGFWDATTAAGLAATGSSTPSSPEINGAAINALFVMSTDSTNLNIILTGDLPQTFLETVTIQNTGTMDSSTVSASTATFTTFEYNSTTFSQWSWDPVHDAATIVSGNFTLAIVAPIQPPAGKGDITNPETWEDTNGNIPPVFFTNVPQNQNYPLNGDGRYWFQANAFAPNPVGAPITFIGDPNFIADTICLQWSVLQVADDGSALILAYSIDGGDTWVTTTMLPQTQLQGIQNGQVEIDLTSAIGIMVKVYAVGGTSSSTAKLSQVAVAITRNSNEGLQWDSPNPFNPMSYNAQCMDEAVNTDTLANLRIRILRRLGYSAQAASPPPGMADLVNEFLTDAQQFLYRRYTILHTLRWFRWKLNPLQRFYSLKDNDEDILCNYHLDPYKQIAHVAVQDNRNVWYPLIQGIPPQLYTMIDKPWRPARYEIRQALEIYPAPDQSYWLWIQGNFGLRRFTQDSDATTLDAELVFLWALGNAKMHYGQGDAQAIVAQANAYRLELVAGTHATAHYIPGSIPVPPAIRPTLIQYQDNQGG